MSTMTIVVRIITVVITLEIYSLVFCFAIGFIGTLVETWVIGERCPGPIASFLLGAIIFMAAAAWPAVLVIALPIMILVVATKIIKKVLWDWTNEPAFGAMLDMGQDLADRIAR